MTAWHAEFKESWTLGADRPYTPKQHILRNHIDDIAVKLLNSITLQFDAKYVISSTHRKHIPMGVDGARNLKQMQKYFADFGLTGEVIGYTPCHNDAFRGREIEHWMRDNPGVERYAIIDDSDDMLEEQQDFFVHTNCYDGLLYKDYKKLLDIFSTRKLVEGVDY
jgi:hypothetical protein